MNENYPHPAMPADARQGILKGMYRLRQSVPSTPAAAGARVQLLGSGTILREVLAAADLLANDWGIAADVWSVTSFTELRRDGLDAERRNRLHPEQARSNTWVGHCLTATTGPVIAATDYLRALPDMIRAWVPRRYVTLGTDGYGRSDTRANLRDFFEVERRHVAIAALHALAEEGLVARATVAEAILRYGIDSSRANPWDT
jgi:pyruvate dehydrogenase E1 component